MLSPQLGRWFWVAVGGVALMGKVCYWEWALRFQSLLLFISRWPATMHASL